MMEKLISIIGKAPNELSYNEFIERLTRERDRVRRAIEYFRSTFATAGKKPKAPSAKKKKFNSELETLMKQYNLTMDEVLKFVETL